jgi:hypothetical protein
MKIKIFKIRRLFASIIIVSLILTPLSVSVSSSDLVSDSIRKKSNILVKTIDTISDDINFYKEESVINEKGFTKLYIVINFIKLIFKDCPEIVAKCQQALVFLLILPDSVCRLIYWFVFSPILQLLDYIWNFHPDYIIQYYAYLFMDVINDAYYSICDWIPGNVINSKSVYGIASLSEFITSYEINQCPCLIK